MKPWIEKYRPKTLDEVQGHEAVKETLKSFITEKNYPHILLHGPQGSGKTATVKAFLKDFYGDSFSLNVIEHNSSHERGIDFIRNDLIKECEASPKDGFAFRTIFFCEIDGLTPDAQFALRRTMETYSRNVRFMADCNNVNKMIKPIRSRFAEYYMQPLSDSDVRQFLLKIQQEEQLPENYDIIEYIATFAKGDLRSAINFFQSISHIDGLSLDMVKELMPTPDYEKVEKLIQLNQNGSTFEDREILLKDLLRTSGDRVDEILTHVYDWYYEFYDGEMKGQLLLEIGEFINRMNTLHVPNIIQLRSCLERIKQIEGVI